jgi:hypothetical protein
LPFRSRRCRAMTAISAILSLCLTSSADSTKLWFNLHRSTRKCQWRTKDAEGGVMPLHGDVGSRFS